MESIQCTHRVGGAVSRDGLGKLLAEMRLRGDDRRVGLDIQGDTAYAVTVEEIDGKLTLVAQDSVRWSLGTLRSEAARNRALRSLLGKVGKDASLLTCGLPPPRCRLSPWSLDQDSPPTNKRLWKAASTLGFSPEDSRTVALGLGNHDGSRRFVMAASHEDVDHLLTPLHTRDRSRSRVTSSFMALRALVAHMSDDRTRQRCAVLHIGPSRSLLAVFENGHFTANKSITVSETDLLIALMRPFTTSSGEKVELSSKDAKYALARLDLRNEDKVRLPGGITVSSSELLALMRPDLERLAVEIAKVLRTHTPSGVRFSAMGPIFITGDGAAIRGIEVFLEKEIRIETAILNPLAGLSIGKSAGSALDVGRNRHRLALAIGYALDETVNFDLTPRSFRLARTRSLTRWGSRAAAVLATASLIALSYQARGEIGQIEREKGDLESIVDRLRSSAERSHRAIRLQESIREQQQAHMLHRARQGHVLGELHRALSAMPETAFLDLAHAEFFDHTVRVLLEGSLRDNADEDIAASRVRLLEGLADRLGRDVDLDVTFDPGESITDTTFKVESSRHEIWRPAAEDEEP